MMIKGFKMKIFLLFLGCVLLLGSNGEDIIAYTDLSTELTDAKDAYFDKQTLIPVSYTNMTMEVTVGMSLASVNDFNELAGYLEISGYLRLNWTDQSSTAGRYDITVLLPSSAVWKPPLLLVNSIKDTSEIGDTLSKIRCNVMSWKCEWKPWIVLRGACTPDVRFYPFDRQTCTFKIASWGYTSSELTLKISRSEWDVEYLVDNAEWTIESTKSEDYIQNNVSFVEFTINLKRIPTYYLINLIFPVILLAVVNVFVFILPAESGERVGFSITCFLSFVVLLNIIMGFIPSSSVNLAHICYYTFIMMVFSCGMSLATIVTLWIHFKSENSNSKVPAILYGFIYILKCRCCYFTPPPRKRRISSTMPLKVVPLDSVWDEKFFDPESENEEMNSVNEGEREENEFIVTWKDVAKLMDIFFLLGFLGGQIFYSVGYLLPLIFSE